MVEDKKNETLKEDHFRMFKKAYSQIMRKKFSFAELVEGSPIADQLFFFGSCVIILFLLPLIIKKLVVLLISFVTRFIVAVMKESIVVAKTVLIAVLILTLAMACVYSTALIAFIAKSK